MRERKARRNAMMGLLILVVLLLGPGQWAVAADRTLAETRHQGSQITFVPTEVHKGLTLTVAGPGIYRTQQVYAPGEHPGISLVGEDGKPLADGLYRYELRARPVLAKGVVERLVAAREAGEDQILEKLQSKGVIPRMPPVQTGSFMVRKGAFVNGEVTEAQTKDHIINDDLIVKGSHCVGFDCIDGEYFGWDTFKLKENTIRLLFHDTSTSTFPNTDWRILINSSPSGWSSFFAIEDATAMTTPFTIMAGAPNDSLVIDEDGDIGLGTQIPAVDLHIVDHDTPAVRFDQDATGGWVEQVWDIAGNETNFFIRDITNDSELPFRIQPSAPSNSLTLTRDGVGIGTFEPDAQLHVKGSSGDTSVLVEEANEEPAQRTLLKLVNNGAVRFDLVDNSTETTWVFQNQQEKFAITMEGTGAREFELDNEGNLVILGTLTVRAGELNEETYPDYVFDSDYDLMPLDELRSYIEENGHLPEIPTMATVRSTGLNMTHMQVKLLEKIEELTLYTLAHEETLKVQEESFQSSLAELEKRLHALEAAPAE